MVLITVDDIGRQLKAKSCEPCGINVIPYPLSTGSHCGNPMYFSFHCNTSTGKLSFKTQNGTYNITTIDQDVRTFVIQDKYVDHCNSILYGQSGGFSRKKKLLALIVGVTIASVIVLSSIFLYTCILMRKKAKRRGISHVISNCLLEISESQQNTERNAALMYCTEKRVKNFIEAEELNEEDKKGIDVPFFDLDSILLESEDNEGEVGKISPVAGESSSVGGDICDCMDGRSWLLEMTILRTWECYEENKLGRGGFGPVYKVIFINRHESVAMEATFRCTYKT
ncbi:hypothetical protein SADUNF_Sadunf19G0111000 [Salix dunnii]|uniref:Wall-associated receptor kinase galacturonan-binding domain-containing protein n=1 Tax=Salix dunnii TaxID=1413687 RepID=A0A835J4Z9_9ROSI|nr:hypothetical protein SADUNF_Sadunf19G0111000 [Salix dunnii]